MALASGTGALGFRRALRPGDGRARAQRPVRGAGLEEVVRQAGRARGAKHAADDDDPREGWRLPPGGFRAYIFFRQIFTKFAEKVQHFL